LNKVQFIGQKDVHSSSKTCRSPHPEAGRRSSLRQKWVTVGWNAFGLLKKLLTCPASAKKQPGHQTLLTTLS
jgi:hypothetical protein